MNNWNNAYTRGNLRKPTDTDDMTPLQPYDGIYTAAKWLGRAAAVLALVALFYVILKGFWI